MSSPLQDFLVTKPVVDGAFEISAARSYQHDEGDYDRQYNLERFSTEDLTREGGYVVDICRRHGLPLRGASGPHR